MKIPSLVALTCKEVAEIVGDYLEDEMTAADAARFEQHLYACTWCMTYLEQMRTTITALGAIGSKPADDPTDVAETEATRARLTILYRKSIRTP